MPSRSLLRVQAPLVVLFATLVLISCEDDSTTPPPPEPTVETHTIRDVDYVKDRYFLFDDPADGFLGPENEDSLQVFLQLMQIDLAMDPSILRLKGWAIPDPLGDGQAIWDAAATLNAHGTPNGVRWDYRLLTPGDDYDVITDTGIAKTILGIVLDDSVLVPQRAIGVRYKNVAGEWVGGSYHTLGVIDFATGQPPPLNSPGDLLMLKMLRAPDPDPNGPYGSTWALEMRNVYDLGFHITDPGDLAIQIEDVLTARSDATSPVASGVRYVRIFGLDRPSGPLDGKVDVDFLDLGRGRLWFPDLHAFAPDPANVNDWTDGQFAFTGPYQAQYDKAWRIYTDLLNASDENDVHQYVIKATLTTP